MNDIELKELWQAYDHKLERSLELNLHLVKELQKQKARSALRPLTAYNIIMIVLGLGWVAFLAVLISHALTYQRIFFIISAVAVILFNIYGIIMYIYHILLIQRVDNSNSVTQAQKQLATLQASAIRVVRILFLQTPFYGIFYYTPAMLRQAGIGSWISMAITVGALVCFSIWLYRNIDYKNMHKKWFRNFFSGIEWNGIIKARAFLDEIEEFERG